jgi:hypothetical protein
MLKMALKVKLDNLLVILDKTNICEHEIMC